MISNGISDLISAVYLAYLNKLQILFYWNWSLHICYFNVHYQEDPLKTTHVCGMQEGSMPSSLLGGGILLIQIQPTDSP